MGLHKYHLSTVRWMVLMKILRCSSYVFVKRANNNLTTIFFERTSRRVDEAIDANSLQIPWLAYALKNPNKEQQNPCCQGSLILWPRVAKHVYRNGDLLIITCHGGLFKEMQLQNIGAGKCQKSRTESHIYGINLDPCTDLRHRC